MIFGRVTRGDGGPLTGAALTLCDLAGDQLDRATADDGGHYQLVPPTGGTYLVICSSTTHQPQASLVAVSDRPLRHDLSLSGGGSTLHGTVGVRRSGSVATNGSSGLTGTADVVLTLTDVRGAVIAVARSGADGAFTFAELSEGVYTLTAAAPNLAPVAETVQMPAEGEVTHDLTLAAQTYLTGTVRSAGVGRPIPDALTTLVGGDGNVVGSAVTAEDGTFRFDDVAEGVYTITASGYAPVASEIEVGPGRPSDVMLTLVPPMVDPGHPGGAGSTGQAAADGSGAPNAYGAHRAADSEHGSGSPASTTSASEASNTSTTEASGASGSGHGTPDTPRAHLTDDPADDAPTIDHRESR